MCLTVCEYVCVFSTHFQEYLDREPFHLCVMCEHSSRDSGSVVCHFA